MSGERDSNPRHPAPKAGILTGLNYHPKLNGLTIFGALSYAQDNLHWDKLTLHTVNCLVVFMQCALH